MKKESGPAIRLRRRHDFLRDGCCLFVACFISFVYHFIWKGELFSGLYDVLIPPICSLMCKCCEFLVEHKKQSLAVLFFLVEAFSLYLDIFGKNILGFLAAAYLLSVFVFSITVQTVGNKNGNQSATNNRSSSSSSQQAEKQLRAVEVIFATVQMMYTFFHFVWALASPKKINLGFSIFPLLYSFVALVFAFKYGTDNSHDRTTVDGQANQEQPNDLENPSAITTSTSASTPSTIFTSSDPVSGQTEDFLV